MGTFTAQFAQLETRGPLFANSRGFSRSHWTANDANACALAEWKWGLGGVQESCFLTFGTGMGAGLILNGKLYTGANDMAGEIGHVRLSDTGPWLWQPGSFEGYCSGGRNCQPCPRNGKGKIGAGNHPWLLYFAGSSA